MPLNFNAKPTFDHPAAFGTMGSFETFAAQSTNGGFENSGHSLPDV
jgi:hypothetical protein